MSKKQIETDKKKRASHKGVRAKLDNVVKLVLAGENVRDACKIAQTSTSTLYKYINNAPVFKKKFYEALEIGDTAKVVEAEAVLEHCWKKAQYDPKYQTSLLFFLKSRDKRYREKQETDINIEVSPEIERAIIAKYLSNHQKTPYDEGDEENAISGFSCGKI